MSTLPVQERPAPEPPGAWPALVRLAQLAGRPLERFLHIEASSGILLVFVATVALAWANSPWRESYYSLWQTPIGVRVGRFAFERSLEWIVNDGLMVIFFFVVGMEIRREVHEGELSEWRRAGPPAGAALGGMLAPAALYLAFAGAPQLRSGWGVPMATDIAFAVGILMLLGKRVPAALRVLLLAVAVIDDSSVEGRRPLVARMLRRDASEAISYWLQLTVCVGIGTLGLVVGSSAVVIRELPCHAESRPERTPNDRKAQKSW